MRGLMHEFAEGQDFNANHASLSHGLQVMAFPQKRTQMCSEELGQSLGDADVLEGTPESHFAQIVRLVVLRALALIT